MKKLRKYIITALAAFSFIAQQVLVPASYALNIESFTSPYSSLQENENALEAFLIHRLLELKKSGTNPSSIGLSLDHFTTQNLYDTTEGSNQSKRIQIIRVTSDPLTGVHFIEATVNSRLYTARISSESEIFDISIVEHPEDSPLHFPAMKTPLIDDTALTAANNIISSPNGFSENDSKEVYKELYKILSNHIRESTLDTMLADTDSALQNWPRENKIGSLTSSERSLLESKWNFEDKARNAIAKTISDIANEKLKKNYNEYLGSLLLAWGHVSYSRRNLTGLKHNAYSQSEFFYEQSHELMPENFDAHAKYMYALSHSRKYNKAHLKYIEGIIKFTDPSQKRTLSTNYAYMLHNICTHMWDNTINTPEGDLQLLSANILTRLNSIPGNSDPHGKNIYPNTPLKNKTINDVLQDITVLLQQTNTRSYSRALSVSGITNGRLAHIKSYATRILQQQPRPPNAEVMKIAILKTLNNTKRAFQDASKAVNLSGKSPYTTRAVNEKATSRAHADQMFTEAISLATQNIPSTIKLIFAANVDLSDEKSLSEIGQIIKLAKGALDETDYRKFKELEDWHSVASFASQEFEKRIKDLSNFSPDQVSADHVLPAIKADILTECLKKFSTHNNFESFKSNQQKDTFIKQIASFSISGKQMKIEKTLPLNDTTLGLLYVLSTPSVTPGVINQSRLKRQMYLVFDTDTIDQKSILDTCEFYGAVLSKDTLADKYDYSPPWDNLSPNEMIAFSGASANYTAALYALNSPITTWRVLCFAAEKLGDIPEYNTSNPAMKDEIKNTLEHTAANSPNLALRYYAHKSLAAIKKEEKSFKGNAQRTERILTALFSDEQDTLISMARDNKNEMLPLLRLAATHTDDTKAQDTAIEVLSKTRKKNIWSKSDLAALLKDAITNPETSENTKIESAKMLAEEEPLSFDEFAAEDYPMTKILDRALSFTEYLEIINVWSMETIVRGHEAELKDIKKLIVDQQAYIQSLKQAERRISEIIASNPDPTAIAKLLPEMNQLYYDSYARSILLDTAHNKMLEKAKVVAKDQPNFTKTMDSINSSEESSLDRQKQTHNEYVQAYENSREDLRAKYLTWVKEKYPDYPGTTGAALSIPYIENLLTQMLKSLSQFEKMQKSGTHPDYIKYCAERALSQFEVISYVASEEILSNSEYEKAIFFATQAKEEMLAIELIFETSEYDNRLSQPQYMLSELVQQLLDDMMVSDPAMLSEKMINDLDQRAAFLTSLRKSSEKIRRTIDTFLSKSQSDLVSPKRKETLRQNLLDIAYNDISNPENSLNLVHWATNPTQAPLPLDVTSKFITNLIQKVDLACEICHTEMELEALSSFISMAKKEGIADDSDSLRSNTIEMRRALQPLFIKLRNISATEDKAIFDENMNAISEKYDTIRSACEDIYKGSKQTIPAAAQPLTILTLPPSIRPSEMNILHRYPPDPDFKGVYFTDKENRFAVFKSDHGSRSEEFKNLLNAAITTYGKYRYNTDDWIIDISLPMLSGLQLNTAVSSRLISNSLVYGNTIVFDQKFIDFILENKNNDIALLIFGERLIHELGHLSRFTEESDPIAEEIRQLKDDIKAHRDMIKNNPNIMDKIDAFTDTPVATSPGNQKFSHAFNSSKLFKNIHKWALMLEDPLKESEVNSEITHFVLETLHGLRLEPESTLLFPSVNTDIWTTLNPHIAKQDKLRNIDLETLNSLPKYTPAMLKKKRHIVISESLIPKCQRDIIKTINKKSKEAVESEATNDLIEIRSFSYIQNLRSDTETEIVVVLESDELDLYKGSEKRLAFTSKGNYPIYLNGLIAAGRAVLYGQMEQLIEILKVMSGNSELTLPEASVLMEQLNADPDTFARLVKISLPRIDINSEEIKIMNHNLVHMLQFA